ncbi:Nn.00g006580.m01.CDS01 [Neocucurbitaria sp. VM-36]
MSETATESANHDTRRQNALADIQFASVADDDLTPSEDETPEESRLQLETVQSAIGVSIGEQQTRLTSPKTPAAEKAAALDETDGGVLLDGWEDAGDGSADIGETLQATADSEVEEADATRRQAQERSNDDRLRDSQPPTRLPSPWRAGPKTFQEKVSDHRAVLRTHLQNGRRRASSNGSMTEAVRKYMPFNLPSSISKTYKDINFSLPSFSALSLDSDRGRPPPNTSNGRRRGTFGNNTPLRSIPQHNGGYTSTLPRPRSASRGMTSPQHSITAPIPQREFSDDSTSTIAPPPPLRASHERPAPMLRRSNSEGSLLVYRSKSFASSLGDDTRFESVQEQVNSRLKAIRDSWQDSNFKLPSPSFPNFNFSTRDDLFRSRNGSVTPKARDIDDTNTRRVSFRTTIPVPIPRSTAAKTKRQPSKDGAADTEAYPFFTQALQGLEGDLVILGGYRGSILRSAEPPNRQLWVPIKVGLNLRKVDLEVPLDPDADERMEETIYPSGMLTHIGPVDISKRLFKRLKACENVKNGKLRVHNYGYDWRLSPHFLSRQMIAFLESLPCNRPSVPKEKRGAVVLAHSLGGLIMRHAINQRPELVSGIVYAGVPQRCVNILGPFRNGDDVLFSSRVLTAQVNFSIRTSYALLPLDGKCFINKHTKEEYPVDFFDVNTWKECRLSPCIAAPLPRPEPSKDLNFSVSGLMSAMSQALPTLSTRKASFSLTKSSQSNNANTSSSAGEAAKDVADKVSEGGAQTAGMEPHMTQGQHTSHPTETSDDPVPASDVTIPYDKAVEYLTRVLAETKAFKQELAHNPAHTESNSYPPIALIYGKSTPTVYGAKVESREAIKRADVYDELAFASGDGVVLARAAMVPEGYSVVRGGVVSSDRGHVTLLGDLEAVGRCLHAVIHARRNGVGLGREGKVEGGKRAGGDGLGIQMPVVNAASSS